MLKKYLVLKKRVPLKLITVLIENENQLNLIPIKLKNIRIILFVTLNTQHIQHLQNH